jgi:ABC-type transport system substrate-binding protein
MKAVRNSDYWEKGKPYPDAVQVLYVVDDTTQEMLMKAGGAEVMSASPRLAARFANENVKIISRPNGVFSLVPDSLNADSPFAKLEVRQALEYALDKASLAKAFGYGYLQAAYQLPSPDNMAYDPDIPGRKYDPAKAKQLLTGAGYPNGFETTIIANPGSDRDVLVAIQAQLSAIGIKASLDFPQAAKMQEVTHAPVKPSTLIYYPLSQWANYNTSLNVYFGIPGAFNFQYSLKKPDGWQALYAKSLTTASPDKAILKQANDSLYNDTTVIPVIYSASAFILSPKVHDTGLDTQPVAFDPTTIWLSK